MRLVVAAERSDREAACRELADRLGLEFVDRIDHQGADLALTYTDGGLVLREIGPNAAGPLRVEFRLGRSPSLLKRATLVGREEVKRVIDATAGLGGDAFAMAEGGTHVQLIERSPVVAALLEDGMERARRDPTLARVVDRMQLHVGEAERLLPNLAPADVVYLDPMYPVSGREGGKVKEMRLLRELLGDDMDAAALLTLARGVAQMRVAVKRPLKAPHLADQKPSGSLRGKTVRYDLYAPLS